MTSTQLIIRGNTIKPILEVDGKILPCKKDKLGNRIYTIATEATSCNIRIYSQPHELKEPYWWLFSLFFYIISIFGLFNTFYSKQFHELDYSGIINTRGQTLDLQFFIAKDNAKALKCLSGDFDDNLSNIYSFDKIAKKRKTLCFVLKILSWIAILATIVVITIIK